MLPMLGSVKKPRKLPKRRCGIRCDVVGDHLLLLDFLSEQWGCTKTQAILAALELAAKLEENGELKGRVLVKAKKQKPKPPPPRRDEQAAYIEALRIVLGLRPVFHHAAGTDRAAFETEGEKPTF